MRIVLSADEIKKIGAAVVAMKYATQLARGDLHYVNRDLVEAVAMSEDRDEAIAKAAEYTGRTGRPAKVVMNADVA